ELSGQLGHCAQRVDITVDDDRRDRARVPRLEAIANAFLRTDERDLVGELRGYERNGFVALALEEELLNALRLRLEAHAAHQLHVEVAVLGAHAADVERERGLRGYEARLDVVC